nr:YfiR family protein [uncultured Noviherbaspirillum sp.]
MPKRLFASLCARMSLAVVVIALTGAIAAVAAPAGHSREDAAARAAYLYSFLGYIEWPARALPLTDSPLVIGVVNAEEVAAELLLSTVGRKTGNRSVTIRPLQPGDSMDDIHLLYIGPGEAQQVQDVIRQLPQRWTVTVTDDAEALAGAINFRRSDGRLRFEVSQAAVERGDFKLSSRLMSVAIVQPGQN